MSEINTIANKHNSHYDKRDWINEGNGLLVSSKSVRAMWQEHRNEFSNSIEQRQTEQRGTNADWDQLVGLPRASMLLLGYAAEMFLKAGITRLYFGCSEEMFDRDIKKKYSHDLVKLAKDCAFNFEDDDKGKLKTLKKMILVDARYPVYIPDGQSYSDTVNAQTLRIWSSEKYDALIELVARVRYHVSQIDQDSGNPATLSSWSIDNDGYLAFRTGGNLPARITYRFSSVQVNQGTNSLDDLKLLFSSDNFPELNHYWDEASKIEDEAHLTTQ